MGFGPKPYSRLGVPILDAGQAARAARKYLIARGWCDEWITAENFRWLNRDEVLARWPNTEREANGDCAAKDRVKVAGAILLPYPNDAVYGVARVFYSGEPPRQRHAPKFLTPGREPLRPYIPETITTDAEVPLLLIESPFKAAIAARKGLHGIGVNGCDGCHRPKTHLPRNPTAEDAKKWFRPQLLPYLAPGREVAFLTDADCESNEQVGAAQIDFMDAAAANGCKPSFRPLPPDRDSGGIDDYLFDHKAKEFRKLKTFDLASTRVAELRRFAGRTREAYRIADYVESASEMLAREIKPIEYLFKGLLARGACVLFAGPPKGFKSTFAKWLALVAVGAVPSDWSKFALATDDQLRGGYIDLEEAEAVFYTRLREFNPDPQALRRLLRFTPPKFRIDEQGIAELRKLITEHALHFLIIDSLARVRTSAQGKSASQADAELLDPLTKLAHETGCVIVVITHTGKRKDYDNPLDMIGSTSQLPAAVDDVLILYKPQQADGELQRHLFVAGRHITEAGTYAIERTSHGFAFHGEASEFIDGRAQKEVLAVLRDVKKNGATPKAIAEVLGKTRNSVVKLLGKLESKKLVVRDEKSRYQVPSAAYRGSTS